MQPVLVTGLPGFLGSAIMPHLLGRYPKETAISCLIQSKFRGLAERHASEIECQNDAWKGRIRLLDGDITLGDLGLGNQFAGLQKQTLEIFHFATA